ncbi:3-methyl-2-oxobutanoate hydroxymethyltransferase [uncultured Ruegeria sp.]|uniref:3-methyl-2-oxobutanoate hydroxymethyltransferase n=1 Tax=uncultured Ruegeria sp. TaxID=259304 RepID=UPI00263463B6|nr:3-methyl-2-oxobutanoate hydroxymethyltransferase [uncultured Ruegeria sp.]
MNKALTILDLQALKGGRKITFVQVAREEEAIAASQAGVDMIGTAFVPERAGFARAVPETHFQYGLPWGTHADATEALRAAMAAMQAGAQSIYCGLSPHVIEVLAREGVPVICHVGLVPPKATWTGGFRAVGKSKAQAVTVLQQVRDFENAGAYAVEMEVIPAPLATAITQRTSMLTISLGSGGDCDVQYLFSADLLGENRGHFPRHAKAYRNFAAERDRLQAERVAAYQEYIADVQNGGFPAKANIVEMDEAILHDALSTADKG